MIEEPTRPSEAINLTELINLVTARAQHFPGIDTIKLYKNLNLELESQSPKYIIAVEVPRCGELRQRGLRGKLTVKMNDDDLSQDIVGLKLNYNGKLPEGFDPDKLREVKAEYTHLMDVVNTWQPDSFPALLGVKWQTIYKPWYLREMMERRDLAAHEGGEMASELWRVEYEWLIELCEPGKEPIDVHEDECWLLYKKPDATTVEAHPDSTPEATKVQSHEPTLFSFYRDGDFWKIGIPGSEVSFDAAGRQNRKEYVGFKNLQYILQRPGEKIDLSELPATADRTSVYRGINRSINQIITKLPWIKDYLCFNSHEGLSTLYVGKADCCYRPQRPDIRWNILAEQDII